MIVSQPFDRATAMRALKLARIIVPNSHWFISNESGSWRVVERET